MDGIITASKHTTRHTQCSAVRFGYLDLMRLAMAMMISNKQLFVGEWWRWALVSPDGVAPSWMVSVSASVNLPLQQEVQKLSSSTGSPGWSRKKGHKTVVVRGELLVGVETWKKRDVAHSYVQHGKLLQCVQYRSHRQRQSSWMWQMLGQKVRSTCHKAVKHDGQLVTRFYSVTSWPRDKVTGSCRVCGWGK